MIPTADFNRLWPRAKLALQHLGVPAEHIAPIAHYNIESFPQPFRMPSPVLQAFVKGSRERPLPVGLVFDDRGKLPVLAIVVICEAYDKPRDNGLTHHTVNLRLYPDKSFIDFNAGVQFPWPFVPSEDQPIHKWLAEDHFTPHMRAAMRRLFDAKPEHILALLKEPEPAIG